ncbi:hypothetical protein Asd1617_03037 [Shigella dysenteriae 1617]|uniref:Uncharacterized protein n=1 Tax=Shigella dysenteriae 1617 TaxID=754093 RepID=A0A0A6ZVN2_SHIDY|nr:hypothetical protein Asd1617_03037 [Shigella dysenteriae 1617]
MHHDGLLPIRLKPHHFVEIGSKQTKKMHFTL